jgi:hypothetical protein
MRTILFTLVVLASFACTSTSETAPQNLPTGSGKADRTASSSDTRHLICQLEYETFSPTFLTAHAATIDTTYDQIFGANGLTATDGNYTLYVARDNTPGAQLPFDAALFDAYGDQIAYIVLPDLATTAYFNFELGAAIPLATVNGATFDNLRAYCAARAM